MDKDCKCLTEAQNKIAEQISKDDRKPNGYRIESADWEYKSFYPVVRLYANYIIKSTFVKKDGTRSKERYEHVSIYFSYCPFCGKKYNDK